MDWTQKTQAVMSTRTRSQHEDADMEHAGLNVNALDAKMRVVGKKVGDINECSLLPTQTPAAW